MIRPPSRFKQRGYFLINPYSFGATADPDPYFANVSALLHFDGADGATTTTDITGKVWTANGNAQLDTAQAKFGTSSGLFDGNGDYFSTTDAANLTYATNEDFTIDFFVRFNTVATRQIFLGNPGSPIFYFDFMRTGTPRMSFVGSGAGGIITGATDLSAGVWYHIAVARVSNTMRLFVNGVVDAIVVTYNSGSGTAAGFQMGCMPGVGGASLGLNGWLDEVRYTKGVGRYTTNFTPPTAPFPNS